MKSTAVVISALIVLILALWIGIEAQGDPGYFMIHIHDIVFETSVWFALAIIIVVFFILYIIIRLLTNLFQMGRHYRRWSGERTERKAIRLTQMGYLAFGQGDWATAEKAFVKAAKHAGLATTNYLAAARAAQAQQHYTDRDAYLRKAYGVDKGNITAIQLTQAQLQVSAGQWEQAKHTLEHLKKHKPTAYSLQLQSRIALEAKDWTQLQNLLPKLRKKQVLSATQLEGLEETAYRESLEQLANDIDALQEHWNRLPRDWRQDPTLLQRYIELLIEHKKHDDAMPLIAASIAEHWDDRLIKLFGDLQPESPAQQIKIAQKWLKKKPDNDTLLLTLAHISYREKLWGQAKDYCENAIAIKPTSAAYQLLGGIMEALDQDDIAMECYRKALSLSYPTTT